MVVSRKGSTKSSAVLGKPNAPGKVVKATGEPETKKSHNKIKPCVEWYSLARTLNAVDSVPPPTPELLARQFAIAKSLHDSEVAIYEQSASSGQGDAKFLNRVLTSGTTSDRLSALTLVAQSSPLHNTRALASLLSTAQKKNRDESLKGLRALVDWWVGGGAPDRKLRYFQDQPLTHPDVSETHKILWYFEDWLKKFFWDVLQLLERLSLDQLSYVRTQTIGFIATLLISKPEQEQNLLRLLVNKLGDAEKSVASKASYHILRLLQGHPNMKGIVVSETSSQLLRPVAPKSDQVGGQAAPSVGKKAPVAEKREAHSFHMRYYATITLNQIVLSPSESDQELAKALVNIYFEMFKLTLERNETTANPPQNKLDLKGRQERRKEKGRTKQAETRRDLDSSAFSEVKDGNEKYLSAILTGLHRAVPYAANDADFFSRHMDTLFRFTHSSTFNISIQSLLLIFSIISAAGASRPAAVKSHVNSETTKAESRYYRSLYASLFDTRLSSTSKQSLFLNLLLKSMLRDPIGERLKAFIRRLNASLVCGPVAGDISFVCGALYVLGAVADEREELRSMILPTASGSDVYDPRKREPEFASGGRGSCWELAILSRHYHPSVRLHAKQLLTNTRTTANADLSLNTLIHFLDRFAYRNPKKTTERGASAMQPLSEHPGRTLFRGTGAKGEHVMTGNVFRQQDPSRVPADQMFYHKYFELRGAPAETSVPDLEEGSQAERDDISEAEIWEAMKTTLPGDAVPMSDDSDDEIEFGDSDGEGSSELLPDSGESDGEESMESDEGAESEGGEETGLTRKRKRDGNDQDQGSGKRKRKAGQLPVFASYEDYSKVIEDGPEDNL